MIIRWDRATRHPIALFIAPWFDASGNRQPGHVVGYLGADGEFTGCRDVRDGPDHDACLEAWRFGAREKGLPILDLPDARP